MPAPGAVVAGGVSINKLWALTLVLYGALSVSACGPPQLMRPLAARSVWVATAPVVMGPIGGSQIGARHIWEHCRF